MYEAASFLVFRKLAARYRVSATISVCARINLGGPSRRPEVPTVARLRAVVPGRSYMSLQTPHLRIEHTGACLCGHESILELRDAALPLSQPCSSSGQRLNEPLSLVGAAWITNWYVVASPSASIKFRAGPAEQVLLRHCDLGLVDGQPLPNPMCDEVPRLPQTCPESMRAGKKAGAYCPQTELAVSKLATKQASPTLPWAIFGIEATLAPPAARKIECV